MYAVWALNYGALIATATAPSRDEDLAVEIIQNVRPSEVAQRYQDEVARTLHNYVAATASLVDHGRRHVARYANTPFASEFEARNAAVRDLPEASFIRGLRNYLLHYALLFVGYTASALGEGFDYQAEMNAALLLQFDGWSSAAKSYIRESGDKINLVATASGHAEPMNELYGWVLDQFPLLHAGDINGLNLLIREQRALGGRDDGD